MADVAVHDISATCSLADQVSEALDAANWLTTAELESLIGRAGRNYGPMFLDEAYAEAKVAAETVTALVGQIWSAAEYPDRQLDHDTWRWLFDVAGFTIDGKPEPRPTTPIVLWRGSVPERRTDWSWSTDRAVAEKYAFGSMNYRPIGRLYTVTAPTHALLCANNGRDEAEIVVDTRGLQITEAIR